MTEANDIEGRAREMGWRPQAEFRGDPANWVDAQEFVERGEKFLPLVKAENRKLHEKTDELSREVQRLTAALGEQRQSMEELAKFSQQQLQDKLDEQKRKLRAELREAKKDDDDDRIEEIEDALDETEDALKRVKEKPTATPAPTQPPVVETPEYKAWAQANPWFGGNSAADAAKTAAAQRFGVEAAAAGKRGQAFFDAVDAKMAEAFPQQRRADPTEDGRPSGGGGGASGGKGFDALPADAKEYARKQAAKFVGENKMFKTEKAWFEYYTKQYNAEAA